MTKNQKENQEEGSRRAAQGFIEKARKVARRTGVSASSMLRGRLPLYPLLPIQPSEPARPQCGKQKKKKNFFAHFLLFPHIHRLPHRDLGSTCCAPKPTSAVPYWSRLGEICTSAQAMPRLLGRTTHLCTSQVRLGGQIPTPPLNLLLREVPRCRPLYPLCTCPQAKSSSRVPYVYLG